MDFEEVLRKSKEFAEQDIGKTYIVAALLNEWMKETGGTLDDYLNYLDTHCVKKDKQAA